MKKISKDIPEQELENIAQSLVPENQTLIYCGPDIPKKGLKKFRVYSLPLAFEIQNAIVEFPIIENLLTAPENLETFREKIKTLGTPQHEYYKMVSAII